LTGVSLAISIFINLTTVQEVQKQNTDIRERQLKIEQHLKELEERVKNQSNSPDTTSTGQTN
jgi:low affinity Fe/Cu permease